MVGDLLSTLQYLRKISVIVATAAGEGLDFADFRVSFQVRRGDRQTPNSCDIRILNLSDATAKKIGTKEFTQISLKAGYEGNFGVIFQGQIKQVRKGRIDQKTTYVDITAADGDSAYHFATISLSLAANFPPVDGLLGMIQSLAQAGIQQPAKTPQISSNKRVRGRVFYGVTRDELRDFCNANDMKWSIQDGVLTLIPMTGYLPAPIPVISPSSGLIGVPEQTQNGIEMRVLLNPQIKIGQLVKLDSSDINLLRLGLDSGSQSNNLALQQQVKTNADGLYYVMVANHSGDTRGAGWYTDMVCLAVDATITQSTAPDSSLPANAIARN